MVHLTLDLLRKRADHHDDTLDTLNEISLHQCNITTLGNTLHVCRRLTILYLHNNLLDDTQLVALSKCKQLRYLNVTLNNLKRLSHLRGLEKLSKLDVTLNFIALKTLAISIAELQYNAELCEFFITGNPCTIWPMCRLYIISQLKQLQKLDGKEITRAERIEASVIDDWDARLQAAIEELSRHEEKESTYSPELRLRMHEEAEKKEAEKVAAQKGTQSGDNDLWQKAQDKLNKKIDTSTLKENELPSQRNIAKLDFSLTDSADGKYLLFELFTPKYLDSSLIDVDLHPLWLQIVVKGKLFLLHTDHEIVVHESIVQRTVDNGHLRIKLKRLVPSRATDLSRVTSLNSPKGYIDMLNAKQNPQPGTRKYQQYVKQLDLQHAELIKQLSAKRSTTLEAEYQLNKECTAQMKDDEVPPLM